MPIKEVVDYFYTCFSMVSVSLLVYQDVLKQAFVSIYFCNGKKSELILDPVVFLYCRNELSEYTFFGGLAAYLHVTSMILYCS